MQSTTTFTVRASFTGLLLALGALPACGGEATAEPVVPESNAAATPPPPVAKAGPEPVSVEGPKQISCKLEANGYKGNVLRLRPSADAASPFLVVRCTPSPLVLLMTTW